MARGKEFPHGPASTFLRHHLHKAACLTVTIKLPLKIPTTPNRHDFPISNGCDDLQTIKQMLANVADVILGLGSKNSPRRAARSIFCFSLKLSVSSEMLTSPFHLLQCRHVPHRSRRPPFTILNSRIFQVEKSAATFPFIHLNFCQLSTKVGCLQNLDVAWLSCRLSPNKTLPFVCVAFAFLSSSGPIGLSAR